MLKKGDKVTLSINPVIQLADYRYVKPHAAITHEIESNDAEGIQKEIDTVSIDLRKLCMRACGIELGMLDELYAKLDDDNADGLQVLLDYCMENINGITRQNKTVEKDGKNGEAKSATKKAVKKIKRGKK